MDETIETDEDVTFEDLGVSPEIVERLKQDGIEHPTKVQEETIKPVFEGEDVLAESETGSGKTLCFALPIIQNVTNNDETQALVLAPTRELAKQNAKEFKKFALDHVDVLTIYGGVSYKPQIEGAKTANVVVGTPGRVLDLLNQGKLDVSNIDYFVLDEADRMLDMGFRDELEGIMDYCPPQRQDLWFSATIPRKLRDMVDKYQLDPIVKKIKRTKHTRNLEEKYVDVKPNRKLSMLYTLLKDRDRDLSLVFCRTKNTTRFVAKVLRDNGIDAQELNGDMSQHQREQMVEKFKNKNVQVIVATDVAARGLHIDDITHVFNYDVPDTVDTYTHRIGRSGRQGAEGEAITLLEKDQHHLFRKITRVRRDIEKMDPDSMDLLDVKIPQ